MSSVIVRPCAEYEGKIVHTYTIMDGKCSVCICGFGATVMRLMVPNREGELTDVVLGYDTLAEYIAGNCYFGATVGRYANRIAGAAFELDGKRCELYENEPALHNCLHGGRLGFNKHHWQTRVSGDRVVMSRTSPDGEENFPGALDVEVTFSLSGGVFGIEYRYVSQADTPVNLTNHSYFNLNGQGSGDVLGHTLQINASEFCRVDEHQLPVLPPQPVAGTKFDFTKAKKIGVYRRGREPQFAITKYIDHPYILDPGAECAAVVCGERSGIEMRVVTDCPVMQVYTGNGLDCSGKRGAHYGEFGAVCFETQFLSNSINSGFEQTVAKAGVEYRKKTEFIFSTR